MAVYIYGLYDPLHRNDIRYVGKAIDQNKRLNEHIWKAKKKKSPLNDWINFLALHGRKPEATVLKTVDENCWQLEEIQTIKSYRDDGYSLLNKAKGGNQPDRSYMSKEEIQIYKDVRDMGIELVIGKRGKRGSASDGLYATTLLACMVLSDRNPLIVPQKWKSLEWDKERFGELTFDLAKKHMSPNLFMKWVNS